MVQSPSQIPEWLNMNNTKLHIVYHKDYISEFLLYGFISKMNLRIKNLPFLFNCFGRIKINDGIMNLKENYK